VRHYFEAFVRLCISMVENSPAGGAFGHRAVHLRA
jgi:hypothetical protein